MKIIVGAVAKNIESQFFNFLILCQQLFSLVNEREDLHICVYENNSTDNTRNIWPVLQSLHPNIHIQTEDLTEEQQLEISRPAWTWDKKPCRMVMIAAARNKLLKMIEAVGYTDEDKIVMIDADMVASVDAMLLLRKIREFPADADAIFANGLTLNNTYYDTYALRLTPETPGPELIGEKFSRNLPRMRIVGRTPVCSAFGGLGIYRAACIRDNQYSAFPTQELNTLYRNHISHGSLPNVTTHYEGVLLGLYLFEPKEAGGFFYHNNSGYSWPVVCEHSTFHARMTLRGQGRFFIDPELIYQSGHY